MIHITRRCPVTGPQLILMRFLDDGPEEDSVGLMVEEMNCIQIGVCDRLVEKGFARFDDGWLDSGWYRLTATGRMVLQQICGAVERHIDRRHE